MLLRVWYKVWRCMGLYCFSVTTTFSIVCPAGGGMGIYTGPRKLLGPGELFASRL
jgi:hypothetical protein